MVGKLKGYGENALENITIGVYTKKLNLREIWRRLWDVDAKTTVMFKPNILFTS
jgi:hypothetical protein